MSIIFKCVYFVHSGTGIKCWVCRSLEDPKCADPFDNTSTPFFDCATFPEVTHLPGVKATMCRKIRQKVNGEWRYIRSCARLGEPGIGGDERYCLQRAGTFNIHVESCTCNSKDGCNTGTSHQSWNLMILTAFSSLLGFYCYRSLWQGSYLLLLCQGCVYFIRNLNLWVIFMCIPYHPSNLFWFSPSMCAFNARQTCSNKHLFTSF